MLVLIVVCIIHREKSSTDRKRKDSPVNPRGTSGSQLSILTVMNPFRLVLCGVLLLFAGGCEDPHPSAPLPMEASAELKLDARPPLAGPHGSYVDVLTVAERKAHPEKQDLLAEALNQAGEASSWQDAVASLAALKGASKAEEAISEQARAYALLRASPILTAEPSPERNATIGDALDVLAASGTPDPATMLRGLELLKTYWSREHQLEVARQAAAAARKYQTYRQANRCEVCEEAMAAQSVHMLRAYHQANARYDSLTAVLEGW